MDRLNQSVLLIQRRPPHVGGKPEQQEDCGYSSTRSDRGTLISPHRNTSSTYGSSITGSDHTPIRETQTESSHEEMGQEASASQCVDDTG